MRLEQRGPPGPHHGAATRLRWGAKGQGLWTERLDRLRPQWPYQRAWSWRKGSKVLPVAASPNVASGNPRRQESGHALGMPTLRSIASRIALAVERSGKKHVEIATEIGVARPQISMWCSGKRVPELQNLLALAEVLGVSAGWLIDGDRPDQIMDDAERELLADWRQVPVASRDPIRSITKALKAA